MKRWALAFLLSASTACATAPSGRRPAADGGDYPNLVLRCSLSTVTVSATAVLAGISICKVAEKDNKFGSFDKMIMHLVFEGGPSARQRVDAHYLNRAATVLSGALATKTEVDLLVPKENVEPYTGNLYRIVNPIDVTQRSP